MSNKKYTTATQVLVWKYTFIYNRVLHKITELLKKLPRVLFFYRLKNYSKSIAEYFEKHVEKPGQVNLLPHQRSWSGVFSHFNIHVLRKHVCQS